MVLCNFVKNIVFPEIVFMVLALYMYIGNALSLEIVQIILTE